MSKTPFMSVCAAALLTQSVAVMAAPVTYKIDPTHTYVNWEAQHFGTSTNRGRWNEKDGFVVIDREAKTGRAEITIDLTSIDTGLALFDKHLGGKNFFQIDKNKIATFVADQFTFDGDEVASVTGELTMMGKTNPLTLTATNFNCYDSPFLKREVCGGDFEGTLQRSLWGMDYGLPGIPDDIRLLVQIEAVRQDS